MATIAKSLSLDSAALELAQAAATAGNMTLSAYASRALRQQAMADNLERLAGIELDEDDQKNRAALNDYRRNRLTALAGDHALAAGTTA